LSLEARLRERIKREGPISFYEWMKTALYDEREGYYCAPRVRQGRRGDYRTAPETSPLFAATFAACFAKLFAELGSPHQFTIVEVGAGSGDFAQGVLATLKAELINERRWATHAELRIAVFEYIESFYNRRRLHSSLGYRTPAEVEQQLVAA